MKVKIHVMLIYIGSRMTTNQGRLNNIIGPQEKQCTGVHTYTTTRRNKTLNVEKIKHEFIVSIFPKQSVFER